MHFQAFSSPVPVRRAAIIVSRAMTVLGALLLVGLNPLWVWAGEPYVMTVELQNSNNWMIGTTLDETLNSGLPSPFTVESKLQFEEAWNSKDEWISRGTFTMSSDIITSQKEATDKMNIQASLAISYMQYSVRRENIFWILYLSEYSEYFRTSLVPWLSRL